MKKMITKNNKLHIEGQTNERKCKCASCGKPLEVGKGYKVIAYGTFKYVHETCIEAYVANTSTSTYKHDTLWIIEVKGRGTTYESLRNLGWTVDNGLNILATNTLNKFKVLDGFGLMTVKVDIIASKGHVETISFLNIGYKALDKAITLATKKAISIDKYGYDKGITSLHKDFNNI